MSSEQEPTIRVTLDIGTENDIVDVAAIEAYLPEGIPFEIERAVRLILVNALNLVKDSLKVSWKEGKE
ncbi:MAG: hypothetical protein IJT54_04195 [Candidatus Methanomethylophilaceae archaeon]|nr:hypothetical protein [Candidatus Methanomethylophilaceae archaeon]